MDVTIKVTQMEMPVGGKTEILKTVYGNYDCDRSVSEFFVTFLPFLSGQIAQALISADGICTRSIKIVFEYGDKDISELRNEVSQ